MLLKIGRKRRAAGWTLLVLGVLVAGVWVASRWLMFRAGFGSWAQTITTQGIVIARFEHAGPRDLFTFVIRELGPNDVQLRFVAAGVPAVQSYAFDKLESEKKTDGWLFTWTDQVILSRTVDTGPRRRDVHQLIVCIWPLPLLLWAPAAPLLWSGILARRRALSGVCLKCGYSLAGLGEGVACPECGKGAGAK
ncbi:MAG: hypothetical protein QM783_19255 [Phycisphaerales bacterium]